MISRFSVLFLLMLLLSLPASGVNSAQLPDAAITAAAVKMKARDYRGAVEIAQKAQEGGMKDFFLGMAALRLGEWESASEYLAMAKDRLPLLADYAVYNRALALQRLARFPESLATLQGFVKNYPESPLVRPVEKLQADLLIESDNIPAAADAYQSFIEKYSSGADALEAIYKQAICRERVGDMSGAVARLRNILLKYPASSIAVRADEDLRRLAEHGVRVAPFSAEELLRRGTVLNDLRKYDKALIVFNSISLENQPDEFVWRLILKTGQVQFKARHFKDAEQTFSGLLARNPRRPLADETNYWLAKTLDKNGREEEAITLYTKLAETSPRSNLADNALLAAAFIRKFQNKPDEEFAFLKRLVQNYPKSNLVQIAFWEIGWSSYQSGDLKTAAEYFKKQLDNDETRDRALYWFGRTLAATGDEKGATDVFSALVTEYPFGFYALSYRQDARIKNDEMVSLTSDLCAILPWPSGFERAKTLIAIGLNEEAARELSAAKRKLVDKPGMRINLARLYLEMGDYHAAYSLFKDGNLRYPNKDNIAEWGFTYPLAFREEVAANAAENGVPESLVYAIVRAESSYFPSALSPAGAVGLMQVMPATAAAVARGVGEQCSIDRLTLPDLNIHLGVRHLKDLLTLYNGDPVMAVAAYNAGSGNVNRWRKTFGKMPRDQFIENIPFPETREYVKKVLSGAEIYKRLYKLDAPSGPDRAATDQQRKNAPLIPSPALPKRELRINGEDS